MYQRDEFEQEVWKLENLQAWSLFVEAMLDFQSPFVACTREATWPLRMICIFGPTAHRWHV